MNAPPQVPELDGEVLPPGEGGVIVAAAPHPFLSERTVATVPAGLTIAEMLDRVQPDRSLHRYAHVAIGDWPVPAEHWHRVRPKPGTHVTINAIVPRGGGEGGKNPLRILLTIAVSVAAFALGPELGLLIGPSLGLGGATAVALGQAIVGIGGPLYMRPLAEEALP